MVVVELADDDHALSLEVRDDGDGFDERAVRAGIGLASMRERIEAVGGEVSIRSRPGGERACGRASRSRDAVLERLAGFHPSRMMRRAAAVASFRTRLQANEESE